MSNRQIDAKQLVVDIHEAQGTASTVRTCAAECTWPAHACSSRRKDT